jgi:hypothetical protein
LFMLTWFHGSSEAVGSRTMWVCGLVEPVHRAGSHGGVFAETAAHGGDPDLRMR